MGELVTCRLVPGCAVAAGVIGTSVRSASWPRGQCPANWLWVHKTVSTRRDVPRCTSAVASAFWRWWRGCWTLEQVWRREMSTATRRLWSPPRTGTWRCVRCSWPGVQTRERVTGVAGTLWTVRGCRPMPILWPCSVHDGPTGSGFGDRSFILNRDPGGGSEVPLLSEHTLYIFPFSSVSVCGLLQVLLFMSTNHDMFFRRRGYVTSSALWAGIFFNIWATRRRLPTTADWKTK